MRLKWRVFVNSVRYCLTVTSPENVEFSASSGDLVEVEDVFLGRSDYSVKDMRITRCAVRVADCAAGGAHLFCGPGSRRFGHKTMRALSVEIYDHVTPNIQVVLQRSNGHTST